MARKYWIGVAHLKQAKAAEGAGFVAFSHGRESAVRKVSPGDRVIYYSPKTDFEGTAVQAFVALATVMGEPEQRQMPNTDFTPWTRAAEFTTVSEVPVKPMLEDLTFVTNPRHWGMAFRRSLFEITEGDFILISNAMRGG